MAFVYDRPTRNYYRQLALVSPSHTGRRGPGSAAVRPDEGPSGRRSGRRRQLDDRLSFHRHASDLRAAAALRRAARRGSGDAVRGTVRRRTDDQSRHVEGRRDGSAESASCVPERRDPRVRRRVDDEEFSVGVRQELAKGEGESRGSTQPD